MKFSTIALALIGTSSAISMQADSAGALSHQKEAEDADEHLSQLLTSALTGAAPGIINEPVGKASDKENDKTVTKGAAKNYRFHWQYACAFTKWTPTNQFIHAGKKYSATSMTLERFGFVGQDKKCFWGMVGVDWITPLKVNQIKPK